MAVELQKENACNIIPARDLEPGVLAEVVDDPQRAFVGTIVQNNGGMLHTIGGAFYWSRPIKLGESFRVRILGCGELLRVTQ